jgi:uncharacterized DUF497 family protein
LEDAISFDGFDWDEANLEHATQHGISQQEIEQAACSRMKVIAAYERNGEMRYSAVAKTADGVPIDLTFTVRSGRLRPISAHKLKRSRRRQSE